LECLPGATALVPALIVSGFPSDSFLFKGFLPVKKGRTKILKSLSEVTSTMIFYESPYKILKTLTDFIGVFGQDRLISVSRELSKLHEQTIRGSVESVLNHFEENLPKGELVIIVSGKNI
jgi:16S rRNA (cytidine1402-2'-O)-methyltransferase